MSLKSIGAFSTALKEIATTGSITATAFNSMNVALKGMSEAQIAATVSASGLSAAQVASAMKTAGASEVIILEKLALMGFSQEAAIAAVTSGTFSRAQAEAAISANSLTFAEEAATGATVGFSGALQGLKAAFASNPILVIATAITALISGYSIVNNLIEQHNQKIRESQQAAAEASGKYLETVQSLEDYKTKIADLRGSLDSGGLSEQAAYEKRQQLLGIQDELISKIGSEASSFNILSDSINDVNAALDRYSTSQAKQLLTDNEKEYEKVAKEMKKVRNFGNGLDNTIFSNHRYDTPENKKVIDRVKDIFEKAFGKDGVSFTDLGDGQIAYKLNVDARSAVEGLSQVNDALYDLDKELSTEGHSLDEMLGLDIYDTTWKNSISVAKKDAQTILDDFGETYEKSIQVKIEADFDPERDDDYTDMLSKIERFKSDYEQAIQEGNDSAATTAYENMQSLVPEIKEIEDADVSQYFLDVVDAFNAKNKDTQLEIELKAKLADDQDPFGNLIKDAVDQFKNEKGEVDLYDILNIGTDYEESGKSNDRRAVLSEEEQSWIRLKAAAESYGVAGDTTADKVGNLLNLLSELGYISLQGADAIKTSAASLDSLKESAANTITGLSKVQEILNSQKSGKSISLDDYNAEELKDYQSALEYVNGTMQLNADKCREIAEAKAEERLETIKSAKASKQTEYLENARQIEEYRKKIRDANFEEGETALTVQGSIDSLLSQNSELASACTQFDLLSASIKEATGAYQHWLNAQNAGDYGDMADDAVSAIQRIKDTYNSESDIYGQFGSEKFDAAVEFIIPESVDSDDQDAIKSYMDNFQQYLKLDENGSVDGLNIDKFLSNSVEAGLMNYSEEDNQWTLAGQKSIEDFAEGLNLSSGVVQSFLDELKLYDKIDFDISNGGVETMADLAVKANEAAESLREIEGNEDLQIKLDVSDLSTTEEKMNALDATISEMNGVKAKVGVDSSEAAQANDVIQYCVNQKQQLSEPAVMRVDVSQCDAEIAGVISLLQQFQSAQNELEITQSVGADTTEAEAKVNGLASEIQALNPEVKAQLNIDTTSIGTIQESINGLTAEAMVKFGVDDSAIAAYTPKDKPCTVKYNPDISKLPTSFDPIPRTVNYLPNYSKLKHWFPAINRTVNYIPTGAVKVNGTAHASGTARAGGDWGTAPGGSTLVGELGKISMLTYTVMCTTKFI